MPEREAIEFLDAHDDPLDAGGARDLCINPSALNHSVPSTSSTFADAGCTELDAVEALASETVRRGGGGVIVFCAARFQCELVASGAVAEAAGSRRGYGDERTARVARAGHPEGHRGRTYCTSERLINGESGESMQMNKTLADCAAVGVAWHHAGLHPEARTLVERGFRENSIQVICCTTTMATGVNLPASRVVIHGAYQYRKGNKGHALIGSRDLQQMVGRAGRAGFATLGEAFVIAPKPNEIDWRSIRWDPQTALKRGIGRRWRGNSVEGSYPPATL